MENATVQSRLCEEYRIWNFRWDDAYKDMMKYSVCNMKK